MSASEAKAETNPEDAQDGAPKMTVEPVSYTVGYGDYELDYRPTISREERTGVAVEKVATNAEALAPATFHKFVVPAL